MMFRTFVLFLILFFLSLAIFLPEEAKTQILEQTFTENLADFKISTPNHNWYFVPRTAVPGPLRATIRFKFPVNKFVPNTTVQVAALPKKNVNLEKWVQESLSGLPPQVEVQKKKKINHKGVAGYEVRILDPKSETTFLQRSFFDKGKSFVITCTAKTSSFPRFEEEFKMILNSFEIK